MPSASRTRSARRSQPGRDALARDLGRRLLPLLKGRHGPGLLLALKSLNRAHRRRDGLARRRALATCFRAVLVAQHGAKEGPKVEAGLVLLARDVRREGLAKVYGELRSAARARKLAPPRLASVRACAEQGKTLALLAR